jgi:hypothetical protein
MHKINEFNMKKIILLAIICIVYSTSNTNAQSSALKSKIIFATKAKAISLLNTEDEYTKNLSVFDINARMHKPKATKAQIIKFRNNEIKEWDEVEKEKINEQLALIQLQITENKFHINAPDEIVFIKSSLKDEGEAEGYTRGSCIVLKEGVAMLDAATLKDLIIHELFHVLTRHDAKFRSDMYAIIGFTVCNEIPIQGSLKKYKISNPDAPHKDSYITLQKDGKSIECMMILYSKDDYVKGTFFDYLNIGFVKLKGTIKKEFELKNNEPIIYAIDEVENLFEQIGTNTSYIIDPEEALADNFIFSINNKTGLNSPLIVEKIQARLKQ